MLERRVMRCRLEPWSTRLLAVLATAPLLHCGGKAAENGEGGNGEANSGGNGGSGGSLSQAETGGSGSGGGLGAASDTGYETSDGVTHRREAKACQNLLPRVVDWTPRSGDTCQRDEDCTEKPYGHCDLFNFQVTFRNCHYGCTVDADCDVDQICVCGPSIGTCQASNCTTDADCGQGLWCASYRSSDCVGGGFACQTTSDECEVQADCGSTRCDLESDGVRRCADMSCPPAGRPFLIADEVRLARPASRRDWREHELVLDTALPDEEQRALAEAWLSNALMEHASIAAFARFTLELLAVGAPADLIRDSNAAALDETRHAAQCFALASRYAGDALGPGPLVVDGALDGVSLEKLVVTTIAEGCIGETIAAIEAAERGAHATDPVVREVLAGISEDETRHAELAWRFVAWALARDPSLRSVVVREFTRHCSGPRLVTGEDELDLTRHGILSGRARSELRSAVLDGVIRDGASALLATGRGAGVREPTLSERTA